MEMQQEPSGEKQGNITAPEQEGGAWATACPQGARVQKQPFLEQITDAKALGEQSPGSFSALSHPFRWRPCAPNVQRYIENLGWSNDKRNLLLQVRFSLFFNKMRFS